MSTTIFCVRPATRNIGNDVINASTTRLLFQEFGQETALVNVPAIGSSQFGGLTARQVYDMNRLADGVVIGGGNLFENGQITLELSALNALNVPMMIMGVSHGRICIAEDRLIMRSDAIPDNTLRALVSKAVVCHVRDIASVNMLQRIGLSSFALGGCPSLFLPANSRDIQANNGRILLSLRHPERMSVPANLKWSIPHLVRRLIEELGDLYGSDNLYLLCHDYKDIEFARAFSQEIMYFDSVDLYIEQLRNCRQSVTFRLHAFLPCLAFGVPSVNLSYDERGSSMLETIGMSEWDVDLLRNKQPVETALERCRNPQTYSRLRQHALVKIASMQQTTEQGLNLFAEHVRQHRHRNT